MRPLLYLAALLLTLSGCADRSVQPPSASSPAFEATAVPMRITHAVRFVPGAETPAPAERAALAGFLAAHPLQPGDAVFVEQPADPLGARRAGLIRALLDGQGLATVAVRHPDRAPDLVRVTVERFVAVAPECPPIDTEAAPSWANRPLQGLGCATARNLAAMIARPRDLAIGVEPGPTDTEAAIRSLQDYRLGVAEDQDQAQGGM